MPNWVGADVDRPIIPNQETNSLAAPARIGRFRAPAPVCATHVCTGSRATPPFCATEARDVVAAKSSLSLARECLLHETAFVDYRERRGKAKDEKGFEKTV